MIRIMLVDDHALFRKGLCSLIETMPSMKVVGEAASVSETASVFGDARPDIVLMDMKLPDGDGLEAMRTIFTVDPSAKIVMLSAFDFSDQVALCMKAGARGYLSKDLDPQELFRAIETVAAGGVAYGAAQLSAIFAEQPTTIQSRDDLLTSRELEVAELAARGRTNREIADTLCVSPLTVKAHLANIFSKLGIHGRVELAAWFLSDREARRVSQS